MGSIPELGRCLSWDDPLEEAWQPTPVLLTGESHGQRGLADYSPQGCKESDMVEATQRVKDGYLAQYLPTNLLSFSFTHYVVLPYTYCTMKYDI